MFSASSSLFTKQRMHMSANMLEALCFLKGLEGTNVLVCPKVMVQCEPERIFNGLPEK